MNIDDDDFFRILYHPVGYAHSSHLPIGWHSINHYGEPLINYWISTYYQLVHLPESWQLNHSLTQLLLQHWYQAPTIAHLLGGYLLRSVLPHQGLTLFMDPQLLAFIALPLIHQVYIPEHSLLKLDTYAYGVAFIFSQCPALPHALRQRLLLQFPVTLELPTLSAPPLPEHINLFKMALNYANTFPSRIT